MNLFFKKPSESKTFTDFNYLQKNEFYFDSACQTLRPQTVIDTEIKYYHEHNSCGHRVKYQWGKITDSYVDECRENLLKLVNKKSGEYTVAFTLNTTSGINQVLQQLKPDGYESIITSEIEHNSVFLPSIVFADRHNLKRQVLARENNPESSNYGGLVYEPEQLKKAIVILNTTSNIHGLELKNVEQLAKDVRQAGGLLLLDVCQTLNHNPKLLNNVDFDACFGSGHKMYGPSVGFIIIKKQLLQNLDYFLIGGSTVANVKRDSYELIDGDDIYSRIEPGLQNYAGIIGLNEAIKWRKGFNKNGQKAEQYEQMLAQKLNDELKKIDDLVLLNPNPSPIVSLYSPKIDGHKLGIYLSQKNIMCRTGYHCCHYYLKEKMGYPPLLRISLSLNNTVEDIDFLVENLKFVLENY